MSLSQWKDKRQSQVEDIIETALLNVYAAETIYERVDALYQLVHCCNTNPQKVDGEKVQQLKSQALEFASYILDASNPQEAWTKLQKRQAYKEVSPSYLPWNIPQTSVDPSAFETRQKYLKSFFKKASENESLHRNINLNKYGHSVDQKIDNKARYLSYEEREQFRVLVKDGKLFKIFVDGEEEKASLSIDFFDTSDYRIPFEDEEGYISGKALMVISPQGDWFFCSSETTLEGVLYHSSLLAGKAVLFAGTGQVTKGVLEITDNNSGHYTPGLEIDSKSGDSHLRPRQITPFVQFLRKTKLITETLRFQIWDKESKGFSDRSVWQPGIFKQIESKEQTREKLEPNFSSESLTPPLETTSRETSVVDTDSDDTTSAKPNRMDDYDGEDEFGNFLSYR